MKPGVVISLGLAISLGLGGCVAAPTIAPSAGLSAPVELAYILDNQVWVYDADTKQHQVVPVHSSTTAMAITTAPVLLPTGTAVLFVQTVGANTTQPYFELWEYTLATHQHRLLATHQASPTALQLAPNGQYITYLVETVLYLTDLASATTTRLHEGAQAAAWSPNSRRIVYSTSDQQLIEREFTVTGELTEPTTLLTQGATALAFTTNHTLVMVGDDEAAQVLLQYDLNAASLAPLTNLRFTAPASSDHLQLDPSGDRLLYERSDPTTGQSVTWLIYIEKGLAKELIAGATGAIWSNVKDTIYYQTLEPTSLKSSTVTGLNHTVFVLGGSAITSTVTLGNNASTP